MEKVFMTLTRDLFALAEFLVVSEMIS